MKPSHEIGKWKILRIIARIVFMLGVIFFFGMIFIWIFNIHQTIISRDLYFNYTYAGIYIMAIGYFANFFINKKLGLNNSKIGSNNKKDSDKFDKYSSNIMKTSVVIVIVFGVLSALAAIFIIILFFTGNLKITF